ncbi:ATP-binding protein [Nostoc sp. FACHB-152]|uniref:NACHT domain-containing protein n=1 Tax=Nostoc sp. FACHB-152 TaxID=2692837 RepID=UPI001684E61A|nr:ATP-binding protein [Nostoc sp. FACHB-152]MBD2451981.1 ATP-binding protein [Nostoc sp. FACHB-152]
MTFSTNFKSQYPKPFSINLRQQDAPTLLFTPKVTFDLALAVVNKLVFAEKSRYLSEAEVAVMKGAWDDDEYDYIANNSTYSLNYLQRGIAPRLWDLLSETIGRGQRVGKKNLRIILEQFTEEYYINLATNESQKSVEVKGSIPSYKANFYGRTEELAQLKELVTKQRCVMLVGVAGIGKSALATKFLEDLSAEFQPNFSCLIWKSVSHAPSLQDLVIELIELIQPCESELSLPNNNTQAIISLLIKQLRSRKCLLVLDAFDALFQKNVFQEKLDYSLFFRRLIQDLNQSCLLLTSRFLPDEFDDLITPNSLIQELKIEGLDTKSAIQLLTEKGLTDKENCTRIAKVYRGNPSELEAVVHRVNHFFAGNAKLFLDNKSTIFSSKFEAALNQMFGDLLSLTQRQILIYIAEEIVQSQKPIGFSKLLKDMKIKHNLVTTLELIKAIEKLERQSLVETIKDPITQEISFNLQPIIKKYIEIDPIGAVHESNNCYPKIAIAS